MMWKWAAASAIGTSHLKQGQAKQDSLIVKSYGEDSLLACVSDGAGSASQSKLGSWLICRFLAANFRQWSNASTDTPTESIIWQWVNDYRELLDRFAVKKGVQRKQFACTLAAVFIAGDNFLAMHVGDSCIVTGSAGKWDAIFWPENGEYASSTFFLTDEPCPKLNIERGTLSFDNVAVFSDGLNGVSLSLETHSAFNGFFDKMFDYVSSSSGSGFMNKTSRELKHFLESERLCEKTDDDKTLILVTRKYEG